jgi:hypothetical protein
MPTETLLQAALEYAAQGWAVLPLHTPVNNGCSCGKHECKEIGKHPRTRHGVNDATTNATTIKKWWAQWPDANIGIRTGQVSNLVVIDIDLRNGGHLTWANLEAEHGRVDTAEVFTGGGGRHLYFNYAPTAVKGTHALGPGVDLKTDGGYVVAPSSLHATGRQYEWEASEQAHTDMPEWVVTWRRNPQHTDRPPSSPKHVPRRSITPWDSGMRQEELRGYKADLACARALGLEKYAEQLSAERTGSSPFLCLLHDESHPSAWLFIGTGGDMLYHCEHQGSHDLTLPQVRASQAYGEITRLKDVNGRGQAGAHMVWRLRSLYEGEALMPLPVPHKDLPSDVRRTTKKVYEGFLLLLGLKEHLWPGEGTSFTWRFARAWCDVSEREARDAML